MEKPVDKFEFVVNSREHCFLCLSHIPSTVKSELENELPSLTSKCSTSIRDMTQYLEMDMSKVLIGTGPKPTNLVAKVKRSNLKVELCPDCTTASKRFSKLFGELKKIEMKVIACLRRIQENLTKSKETRLTVLPSLPVEDRAVVWGLRDEAIKKCNRKLKRFSPRVTLHKMTQSKVMEQLQRLKELEPEEISVKIEKGSPVSVRQEKLVDEESGAEGPEEDFHDDTGDSSGSSSVDTDSNSSSNSSSFKCDQCGKHFSLQSSLQRHVRSVHLGTRYRCANCQVTFSRLHYLNCHQNESKAPECQKLSRGVQRRERWKYGMRVVGDTGKYGCPECTKDFSTLANFPTHFKGVHLKVKFKCKLCVKQFTQAQSLRQHVKVLHAGPTTQEADCEVATVKMELDCSPD